MAKLTPEEKAAIKEEKRRRKAAKKAKISFSDYPYLLAIKPREKYIFHSDYFQIDDSYATILSYHHLEGAKDMYPPFWGIMRVPTKLNAEITTVTFEQIRRMSKGWVSDHETLAESVANKNAAEQEQNGTASARNKSSRKVMDMEEISRELGNGDAYLQCTYKLMVKAPTLEALDEAVTVIERNYIDKFTTLEATALMGMQRQELSTLFAKNDKKPGQPFYFTSSEFAGSYSLVTHGMEDPDGEYVGKMIGDVNNAAVLFNVDNFSRRVVVANEYRDREERFYTDYWGSKISQSSLFHNRKVVHIILNSNCGLDSLGPEFKSITSRIDLNKGDVNMFEMFGTEEEELSVFATQMQKLILMAEQAYDSNDMDRAIIRSQLEDIATRFYVDQGMWRLNAVSNREKLRVVNVPHKDVPKLEVFVSYLASAHQKALKSTVQDQEKIHATNVLFSTFQNLLSTNGDLFNTTTSPVIDNVRRGKRVIYDFSKLRVRGMGVAMAQLVNVIGFAVGNLTKGDTLIIHGAELIDKGIFNYMDAQINLLFDKGGRVVFLYNDMDKMFDDMKFSHFNLSDYTVMGPLTPLQLERYEKIMGQEIPGSLAQFVTWKRDGLTYLRRGYSNVVFDLDLTLGVKKTRRIR